MNPGKATEQVQLPRWPGVACSAGVLPIGSFYPITGTTRQHVSVVSAPADGPWVRASTRAIGRDMDNLGGTLSWNPTRQVRGVSKRGTTIDDSSPERVGVCNLLRTSPSSQVMGPYSSN